jgi:DNA-directed RNA polymerase subunit RPC12/RpoP
MEEKKVYERNMICMSCGKDVTLKVPSDVTLLEFIKKYKCEYCGNSITGIKI